MAPTSKNRKRSKLLKSIFLLLILGVFMVCFAVLSLPYWLGFALKVATADEKLHFDDYKREGYREFRLEGISFENPQATIHINKLHAFSPVFWFLESRQPDGENNFLRIEHLEVTLPESPPSSAETPNTHSPKNLAEALQLVEQILSQTDRWLPRAAIEQIDIYQGERKIELKDARWANRTLNFSGQISDFPSYQFNTSLNVQATVPVLEILIPDADLELKASLAEQNDSYIGNARIRFRENAAILTARFTDRDWLPESASWQFEDWSLNLGTLGITSPYPLLSFNLNGDWNQDGLNNTLDGHLAPEDESGDSIMPPIDFQSEIGGNFETLTFSRFSLDAPGMIAQMSEPVFFELGSQTMTGDLRLDIDFDLDLLKRDDLQGQLVGFLDLREQAGNPSGQFTLEGIDVRMKTFEFEDLDIRARLDWPELEIQALTARLTTGTDINLTGQIDLQGKEILTTSLTGMLTRETLSALLPEDISLGTIRYSANASGPFSAISHEGSLKLDSLETPALLPLSASINWTGRQADIETAHLIAQSETGELDLKGSGTLTAGPMIWQIQELQFTSNGEPLAQLSEPVSLSFDPQQSSALAVDSLKLTGPSGDILIDGEITYPTSANVTLEANDFELQTWTRDWLKKPPPAITISALAATAEWDNGPAQFDLNFDTSIIEEDRPITARGQLTSDGIITEFKTIEISDATGPWVTISGILPLRLQPANESQFQLNRNEPIDLLFTSSESQNWLDWLSQISSFDFERFKSQIRLNGALNNLTGDFEVEMLTQVSKEEHGMPPTSVLAKGEIENTLLTISNMTVTVAEEHFNMRGSVDLPDTLLDRLNDPTLPVSWEETVFNLQIPPSKLTPLRYLAPQLLSTGGEIEADFKGSVSDGISGFFRVKDVNTRAIFPFGSLRDISADLTFEKSQATLKNISAFIGREPVTLTGKLDYPNWKAPTYEFTIKGDDLPLVRKPGLLLRSDLDLAITKRSEVPTTVTGTVGLKDGLFLLNRNTILGGGSAGGRTAKTRPPFFSIEAPPLSEWVMDISVKGDRFIRVRTPAADGTLSLDMKLQGKLKEPFATGRLEFDEGNLYFPFSSFTVDYGIAELPIGDPFTPMVELIGTSQRFGYDITVEITGSAYEPQVTFTSSPPLSSEQIMLMVVAGENPDGMFDYTGTERVSKLGTYISKGLFSSADGSGSFLNRLSIESGKNLSQQGKETMEIEYRLDDRFQLVGEYDEYDFWNAGLRWRILERKVLESESEVTTE